MSDAAVDAHHAQQAQPAGQAHRPVAVAAREHLDAHVAQRAYGKEVCVFYAKENPRISAVGQHVRLVALNGMPYAMLFRNSDGATESNQSIYASNCFH